MKKALFQLCIFIFCSLFFTTNVKSQCLINYLKNPSFELSAQTTLGNHFPVLAPDWTITGGQINLIKVDGSNYFGGPNSATNGTQYLDIVGASATLIQSYTTTCASVITFRGDFSSREAGGGNWDAKIELVNASNVVVATSTIRTFTSADVDQNPPGADAVWYTMSGTSVSLPAGTYTYRVTMDDYTNFDNAFLCAEPGCVLPVKISDFVASNINCKSNIQWKSDIEINVKQYEIETSSDGNLFVQTGIIAAIGSSNYKFVDNKFLGKTCFYRLKVLDNDGQYKYSDIIKFVNNCTIQTSLTISPNPVVNTLQVNYYDANNKAGQLKIMASSGTIVKQLSIKNGITNIDANTWAKGLYFLSVTGSDRTNVITLNK